MCGIFGIVDGQNAAFSSSSIKKVIKLLFRLSESRGKEASGIVIRSGSQIVVLKEPIVASKLIKSNEFNFLFNNYITSSNSHQIIKNQPLAILGHSRLVTSGQSERNLNNQPVIKDGAVGIHNGVVVNDEKIWREMSSIKKSYNVDTEVIFSLLQMFRSQGQNLIEATKSTYLTIDGSASIAVLFDDINHLLLATNTGSLYYCLNKKLNSIVFASEKNILNKLFNSRFLREDFSSDDISQLKPGECCVVDLLNIKIQKFKIFSHQSLSDLSFYPVQEKVQIIDRSTVQSVIQNNAVTLYKLKDDVKQSMMENWDRINSDKISLRRCTKCILPETMPYISFDNEGVCNYCRNFENREYHLKGEKALQEFVKQYQSPSGESDCIVGFSGGRDSTYGLEYIKNSLKLHPIAFTYDWAMVNDLARRNQARVVSRLGVEQIIVSADIKKKRENIKKNLLAWLKKPDLGMVPLLMAGDKQFYYYFHKIRKQTGVKLFVFCGGHEIEETPFKYGFCGVDHGVDSVMNCLTGISRMDKLKMILYFAKQYLTNPGYINSSIFDTLFAYYCTYLLKDDYLYLYHFIEWDEDKIISTIKDKFDWEGAPDTDATWRIDDGTAAFYNYIYLTMAGFTEFDNFRSYQIREGKITRDRAMELIREENKPRFEAIEWYAEAVGFDINHALDIINKAPKILVFE